MPEQEKKSGFLGFKIRPQLVSQIDALAAVEKRSRSAMASILIEEGLEARELVKESEGKGRVAV